MAQLEFSDITYHKSENNRRLLVRGEIRNSSGRHYNAIAIRLIIFNRNIPLANIVVVINELPNGVTKRFEREAEELEYEQVVKNITRHEVYIESAY